MIGGTLVAGGLTMIGDQAGCRWVDRLPAYPNNLFRLGLIWLSREALSDPLRYQVLEESGSKRLGETDRAPGSVSR